MELDGFSATGPRDANEDSFFVSSVAGPGVFSNGITALAVVSDGMGGYQGGDVASGLVVTEAQRYWEQLLDMANGNCVELDAPAALDEIVQNAHAAILVEQAANGGRGMGATFVGAFVSPTHAWIGHVGDSRAYLVREGDARQLTEDHSQVGRMLARGLITEQEAQSHPDRNRIEQALGFAMNTTEIDEVDLQPGDALLLCSDGVYTVLGSAKLAGCVRNARGAHAAAQGIVKAALSGGTDDNSTAVVVASETLRRRRGADTLSEHAPLPPVSAPRPDSATGKHASNSYSRSSARYTANAPHSPRTHRSPHARSPLAVAVPLAILAALVVVAIVLFMSATGGPSGGGVSAAGGAAAGAVQQPGAGQAAADDADTVMAPQASSAPAPSNATDELPAPEVPAEASNEYIAREDATLKYVDASGVAHRFTEEDGLSLPAAPSVPAGATVIVGGEVDSFGQSKTYRPLNDMYMSALMGDVAQSADAQAYDSALSRIIGPAEYGAFVSELAGVADLGSEVTRLVLDEDALEPKEAAS